MLKKFLKFFTLLLIILTVFSFSINFATDAVTTSENVENSETIPTTETTNLADNIHYGNLYVIGSDIVIDKIVYGSVYAIGNSVTVTGQIENDLYVIANTLKIDRTVSNGGLIQGKVFACANSISFDGACSYLYSLSKNIDMSYDSLVVGNSSIISYNANTKAAFGRDLDLISNNITLGEGLELPIIYGNFNYVSFNEIEIPDGVLSETSTANYITPLKFIFNLNAITSIGVLIINLFIAIITTLVIYTIINKITPNFINQLEKKEKLSFKNLLKYCGIGLVSIISVVILTILLFISAIGSKLGIIFILLYILLYLVSIPIFTIALAFYLKNIFKVEKTYIFYLILAGVSIVLYGLTLIPFIGLLINFISKLIAIGMLLFLLLPCKKLKDNEKYQT